MTDARKELLSALEAELPAGLMGSEEHADELTLTVAPEHLLAVLGWLRDKAVPAFSILADLSGVDGLDLGWDPRFRVSYHLLAPIDGERIRVQTACGADEELPSVSGLWEGANWNEREVWDLMGIRFSGHPDLRRILLHEDYKHGHPLQKQVPTRGRDDDNQ